MELDPGSKPRPADELRQALIEKSKWADKEEWKDASGYLWAWRQGWLMAWPLAKTAVTEAESEVQQFGVSWSEAWARAEARVWPDAKAMLPDWWARMVGMEEAKGGAADALLLAEALGQARAHKRGECVPDRVADPTTIANLLTFLE